MANKESAKLNISVTFRHTESTDALRSYVEDKLTNLLNKYIQWDTDVHVILSVEKRDHSAEAVLQSKAYDLRSKATTEDLYSAIDKLIDNLSTLMRKQKEKMTDHKAQPAVP
jgi:putative sigma-54 modulation protein